MLRVPVVLALLCAWASLASAQTETPTPTESTPERKARLALDLIGGYIADGAQETLGVEKQGRIGYAVFRVDGGLSRSLSYKLEVNPVNESQPLPSCGEEGYFFPNTPTNLGLRRCSNSSPRRSCTRVWRASTSGASARC
jgi:hypothetical protein